MTTPSVARPKRVVRGACTACGKCCQILAILVQPGWPESFARRGVIPVSLVPDLDTADFLATRGCELRGKTIRVPLDRKPRRFWTGSYAGKPAWYFATTCPHLRGNGGCGLHGTADKPVVCQAWPTAEADVDCVPGCGYTIVEETEDG